MLYLIGIEKTLNSKQLLQFNFYLKNKMGLAREGSSVGRAEDI